MQKLISQCSVGDAGRKGEVEAVRKCLPLVPVWMKGEREKRPTSVIAETVEKQISLSVGFRCFSRKWQKQ